MPRTQRPLARGDVYYVGQTRRDGGCCRPLCRRRRCGLVDVDYEPLDVEIDLEKAIE